MATSRFLLADDFLCAICLDVLTEPVSTPCGHNFCKACIQHYWDMKVTYKCPLCNAASLTRPLMKVNTVLSELAIGIKKWAQVLDQSAAGVLCDICSVREDKAVVSCLECLTAFCETHLEPHMRVAGLRGHTLTAPVSDGLALAHQHGHDHNGLVLLTSCAALLQRLKAFAVDVTLDPHTAHCNLIVSPDGKAVMLGATPQNVPDTTKRFKYHAVLSKEGFRSGKFYFEVQVKGKTSWAVGVARASLNRKNPVSMSVRNGCWVMVLDAGQYRAYGPVSSVFNLLAEKLQAVGVFVDYDVGQVSFYNVDANSHIYTFSGQCFGESLHPYLATRSERSKSDLKPLTITCINV